MANLPETPTYDPGVYRIEETDPVLGGDEGHLNKGIRNLANRTAYLKEQVETKAPIDSPDLTGEPTAPTPGPADNTTKIANMQAVQAVVAAAVQGILNAPPGALDTLNELAAALGDDPNFATTVFSQIALKAPLASPGLTGTPTSPTPAAGDNSARLATTAFVVAALATALSPAELLAKLVTVDGSGSGLDADLLDGLDSSAYARRDGADTDSQSYFRFLKGQYDWVWQNGTAGFEVRSDAGGSAKVYFHNPGVNASNLGYDRDGLWRVGGHSFGATSHILWHDGVVAHGPDWIKFPNGIILQWGWSNQGIYGQHITYPVAFTTTHYPQATPLFDGGGNMAAVANPSLNGFTAYVDRHDALGMTSAFWWFAVGK